MLLWRKGCGRMNRFDTMGKDALSRVEEIMNSTKLNEFLHRKEEESIDSVPLLYYGEEKELYPLDSGDHRCGSGGGRDRVRRLPFLHSGLPGGLRGRLR